MKTRIAVAAFASLAMLAGAGAVAASSASGAATTATRTVAQTTYTPPRAHIWDLSAAFHGYQREMGHRGFILTLTNISNHSVSLYGYPGLQLLNGRTLPLPTTTQWGMSYFARNQVKSLIVLSPGETASADISFSVYGTRSNSVLAYFLKVTPPNCYGNFTLRIPYAPALVYLHQVQVTPMAYHTPYIP
jgi:hypothetical protein